MLWTPSTPALVIPKPPVIERALDDRLRAILKRDTSLRSLLHIQQLVGFGVDVNVGQYQIARSLRFRSGNSSRLTKTFGGAPTNNKIGTMSVWLKRGSLGSLQEFFNGYDGTSSFASALAFLSGDTIELQFGGSSANNCITNAVFRDPAAFLHIVVGFDTTQATAANRISVEVNGVAQTFGTANYPAQNAVGQFVFNGANNSIGAIFSGGSLFFDGYVADFYFVDGQKLAASNFAQTDATTGQWIPKAYSGSYGTNGFKLDFSDNSTTAHLGDDRSGNGNTWTVTNFSVTAGTTNDSLVDSPTSYGTDTGAGGEVRGDYCVLNPLKNGGPAPADGNLKFVPGTTKTILCTFGITSGKWYWEFTTIDANGTIGIGKEAANLNNWLGNDANGWIYNGGDGNKYNNGPSAYGTTWAANNVIGVAFDADNGILWFSKQGTWQNSATITEVQNSTSTHAAFTGLTSGPYFPGNGDNTAGSGAGHYNFGQRPFVQTCPTGYKALCSQNLPAPSIVKPNTNFDIALYTGTGSTRSITGIGFQPDLVWIKDRTSAQSHKLTDSSRGTTKAFNTDSPTAAESTDANGVTAFNSDGFSLGTGTRNYNDSNADNYVAWLWKKSATPGFDIQTYTGNATNRDISHSLGVVPAMVMVKNRDQNNSFNMWHTSLAASEYILLDSTGAKQAADTTRFNGVPTSSVVHIGTAQAVNGNTDRLVMWLWAAVAGFSAFGSYTGNGSANGTFVYTGFRPRFVLVKRTDNTSDWALIDGARQAYNAGSAVDVAANTTGTEPQSNTIIDILSNGFKLRTTGLNTSGATYIYAAFAENPFKYARAR